MEKRRFRLRWDSSPGLSIAGPTKFQTQLINLKQFLNLKIYNILYNTQNNINK